MLSSGAGNFSVAVSALSSNRSSLAVLAGLTLKSAILTFTFTPSNASSGLQHATIALNVSGIEVTPGKVLKWFKFNVQSSAWDLKGGDLNATTGLLEYTTTSFSDWAIMETDPPPADSRSMTDKFVDWVQSKTGIIVLCSAGFFLLVVTWGYYYQKRRWNQVAPVEDRNKALMPVLKSPKRIAGIDVQAEQDKDTANLGRMPKLHFTRQVKYTRV